MWHQLFEKVGVPDVEGFSFVGFEVFGDVCFEKAVEFFLFVLGVLV